MRPTLSIRGLLLLAGVLTTVGETGAAPPQLANVSPRGLQSGGQTRLVLTGQALPPAPTLHLGTSPVDAKVVGMPTPQRVELDVSLPPMPAGTYSVRVTGDEGISKPQLVGVDALPERPFAADAGELPVALHGSVSGTSFVTTEFTGTAGERFVAEVEARRLGSSLMPIVELYDAAGTIVALAGSDISLAEDCRLEVVLPTTGTYKLLIRDALYRGRNPSYFRVKLGNLLAPVVAVPLGGQAATDVAFKPVVWESTPQAFSNSLGNLLGVRPLALPTSEGQWIGPAPRLDVSDLASVPEADAAASPVATPIVVDGRISAPDERDVLKFQVTPKQRIRFDVRAQSLGSALDGVLAVVAGDGRGLGNNDDSGGMADPRLDITVPDGVTEVHAILRDLTGQGGAPYPYRLAVGPLGYFTDFDLEVPDETIHVPAGGYQLLKVAVKRRGFRNPIAVEPEGLPGGVVLSGGKVPQGSELALVCLHAPADAAPAQGVGRLVGAGRQGPRSLRRPVARPRSDATRTQPWLAEEFGVAVVGPTPLELAWAEPPVAGHGVVAGTNVTAKLRVVRRDGTKGPVRVTLLTSQVAPKIADGNDKGKPDVAKTLRFESAVTIPADATEATATVLVPAEVPPRAYDLVLEGELLGDDGKTVTATVYSAVAEWTVQAPPKEEPKPEAAEKADAK